MKISFRIHFLVCWIIGCGSWQTLAAQSISTLQRQAERSLEQGNNAEAAARFERAGRLNNSDPALLYHAAEAYNSIRDYHNASNCYHTAKEDPRFPMANLRYARSLKQQGRYEEALEVFQKTGETYRGDQKEVMLQVVRNEIAGCNMATALMEKQDTQNPPPTIAWLPHPIASTDNEFAPIPFSDTLLYFSQAREKQAVLMRCSKRKGAWQPPSEAFGLPPAAAQGFLCGSFSPDGQRFYFAKSDAPPMAKQGSSLQKTNCSLYALRRNPAGEWSEPIRLRSYINLEGSTNLWPFVCHMGEEEWLFFASDKAGGMGGLDLYCCKRPLNADDFDFSFPLNLGRQVNTGGDEVTPYYDVFSQTLWFSSIGHPSLGGLDVQFAVGEGNNWTKPENAGIPINSPADDFFFVLKRDGFGAFMVSNRSVSKEKEGTTDDDLFEVYFPQ